ncbi:MAG: RagB/SusD family nutrient uptake outer membrane protein [Prevotellaceae bacterium]|jgi:tetratricopeptide (TPR) repeat protein|nr:RagB/SusD family nutrient uptake outer membrane protein [Prevotellaceae bacterium]
MKKIITIFAAIICVMHFSSCENFLDVYPTNSTKEEMLEIRTGSDADVMMNGIMREMTSGSYYGRNMMLYADAKGGDFVIRSHGRGYDYLYTFAHSASTGSGSGYWSQIYYCLLQANNLLNGMDKAEAAGTVGEDLSIHRGRVLTLRALMHFDLVRIYGMPYTHPNGPSSWGVPIVTEPIGVYEKPLRSTVEQVYIQILKDIEDARVLLDNTSGKAKKNGYINYYGNRALLARVKLYMGEYDDALAAAEEVMAGPYSLYSNDEWLDSWSTQFGSESIFELGIFENEADLGTTSWGALLLRKGEVSSSVLGYFMASDYYLARLYESENVGGAANKDIRLDIMRYDETSTSRLGSCRKYVGNARAGDKGKYSAVNIKVFRLSEIYLIAAEAALLKSIPDLTKAASYLQEIRDRAPGLAPATSATVSLDMILDERSRELFMEGHRFFDMLRHQKSIEFNDEFIDAGAVAPNNRPKIIQTDGANFFYKCILPIPKSEIDANPGIGEQQNPSY